MTASRLAALLDQATPGPWRYDATEDEGALWEDVRGPNGGIVATGDRCYLPSAETANLRLIALAPDMARLLVDMADAMRQMQHDYLASMPTCECPSCRLIHALLARFAALDEKAGAA